MSVALQVVRHNITDEYTWPPDVSALFHRLSRPLPNHLTSNEFQKILPVRTREMLEEALKSPFLTLTDEDEKSDCIEEEKEVTDLIDTVLSSVRMVRTARTFGRAQEQARFTWTTLITILGISISENVYFAEDISFLRPRTTRQPEPRDSYDFEGKAVLLLSTFIPRSTRPDLDTAGSECIKSERSSESSERPPNDSFASLDLPLGAYVIPGRGKRVDCCLPVICAADEKDIESLVTSVVCQRYVWNIRIPVVGISLSKSGTTASIVFGWSSVDTSNPDAPPMVHLVLSERKDDIRPSLGLFDLTDAVSALYFGQFILGCHSQFRSVERLSKNRDTRDFCWRLDHFRSIPPIEADRFVETWVRNLSSTADAGPSIFHRLRSAFAYMSNSKPNSSKKLSSSNDLLRVPSFRSTTSVSSKGDGRSGHSASEFAALKAEKGLAAMEPGTETWLWERSTLRLFRVKLPTNVKSNFLKQFNNMIELYDQLTDFRWPKEWKHQKFVLPYCDRPSENQRRKLFQDYQAYRAYNPVPPDLEGDVSASIVNHMTPFLRAVSTAQASMHQAASSGAGESCMRSAWDDLMKAACCDPIEDVSRTYLVEKTIGLPKNQALGNAEFPDIFQSRLLLTLLGEQWGNSKLEPIFDSVVFALSQATENKLRSESSTYAIQDRSFEPATAIVDSLYCLEHVVNANDQERKSRAKLSGWARSFLTIFKKPTRKKCANGKEHTFEYQEPSTKETKKMTFNDTHVDCLMCPEVTKSLPNCPSFSVEDDNFLRFYLPFIYIENKRAAKTLRQALHQCQMYCTFGVEFLAAIGITDFPVFGIITAATEGEIIMAWKSSKSVDADYPVPYRTTKDPAVDSGYRPNILVDQNCKKFDLASPLQAFHFFISIHRIFKRQELLAKEIQKRPAELARVLKDPENELLKWMMEPKRRASSKPRSTSAEPASK